MSYMCISHDQAVVPDFGAVTVGSTPVDRHTFAYSSVISNNTSGVFSFKLHVLWYCRYYRTGENTAVLTNPRAFHYGNVGSYPCTFANLHILMYCGEWVD